MNKTAILKGKHRVLESERSPHRAGKIEVGQLDTSLLSLIILVSLAYLRVCEIDGPGIPSIF